MEDYGESLQEQDILREQNVKRTLLLNKPVKGADEDLLHMEIPRWELEGAMEAGANLIGVVSDFGGGKTSLIRSLEEESEEYKVCSICLWNYAGKGNADGGERISDLTHSFLYQLAKETVSAHTATYVNKMLSHNYGMISVDILFSTWSLIILFAGVVINVLPMFQGYFKEDSNCLLNIISGAASFLENNMEKLNYGVVAALVFVLGSGGIVFSSKDSEGKREAGRADVYVVFDYIVTKAIRKKRLLKKFLGRFWKKFREKKYLICIEDVDRLESKEDVLLFIKEIYKYSNMLTEKARERFVFIISASPEMYGNIGEKTDEEQPDTTAAGRNSRIYSKVFDYIIELKPIHQDDRRAVIQKLIKQMEQFWQGIMKDISGEEEEKFWDWIGSGGNLGIRDFKLRLNKALSIYKALSMSERQGKRVRADLCALTAYLEDYYAEEMYMLIHSDKKLDGFMDRMKELEDLKEHRMKQDILNMIKAAAGKVWEKRYLQHQDFLEVWYEILLRSPEMLSEYKTYLFRYAVVKVDETGEKYNESDGEKHR